MRCLDNRSQKRRKVCVQAFATDTKDTFNIKCIIRDVSVTGCLIISSQIHLLPDMIQLVPEGFALPLNGKIMWRDDKRAGVTFLSPSKADVMALLKEQSSGPVDAAIDDDEPLLLGAVFRPASYAERLANYAPPRKKAD